MSDTDTIEQAKAIFSKFGIEVSDAEAIPLAKKVMLEVKAIEVETGKAVTPEHVRILVSRLRFIRPVLQVSDMMFVSNIEQIERILSNNTINPIYQHNGRLVRVEGTQITPVLPEWLTSHIGRFIQFMKYDPLAQTNKEVYPPHACILTILRQKNTWPFKVLPDEMTPKPAPEPPKPEPHPIPEPGKGTGRKARRRLAQARKAELKVYSGHPQLLHPGPIYRAGPDDFWRPPSIPGPAEAPQEMRELADQIYDEPSNSSGVR